MHRHVDSTNVRSAFRHVILHFHFRRGRRALHVQRLLALSCRPADHAASHPIIALLAGVHNTKKAIGYLFTGEFVIRPPDYRAPRVAGEGGSTMAWDRRTHLYHPSRLGDTHLERLAALGAVGMNLCLHLFASEVVSGPRWWLRSAYNFCLVFFLSPFLFLTFALVR